MSNQKRDKLEVIYDILLIIKNNQNSIKPTPLLRFANLSTNSYNQYEKDLIKKQLILITYNNKNRKHISLSQKGLNYIEKYKMIKEFLEDFEL